MGKSSSQQERNGAGVRLQTSSLFSALDSAVVVRDRMTLVRQRSSRAPDKRESREFRHKRDSSTALRSVVRNDKRKSSVANLSVLRLMGVIAFAGEDAIAVVLGGDLYLAEFPVLGRVGWVVAQAVLLVQLLRDFVERGFQFINAVHFEHASAGGF